MREFTGYSARKYRNAYQLEVGVRKRRSIYGFLLRLVGKPSGWVFTGTDTPVVPGQRFNFTHTVETETMHRRGNKYKLYHIRYEDDGFPLKVRLADEDKKCQVILFPDTMTYGSLTGQTFFVKKFAVHGLS